MTLLLLAVLAVVVIVAVAVLLLRAPVTQPTVTPATTGVTKPAPMSASPVAVGQVPASPHPTPQEEVFNGCPSEGDGTDPELNRLKNRVDEAAWQPVTVEALLSLRWPAGIGRKGMAQWSAAEHAQIDPFNSVPVQAEGYLLQARQEGPESPNCHSVSDLDFHTW